MALLIVSNAVLNKHLLGAKVKPTAISTGTRNPFDTHTISDFQARGFGARAEFGYLAHTLVTSHLAGPSRIWKSKPLGTVRNL